MLLLFILLLCFCVIVGALQDARPSTGRCCYLYCCCVSVLLLVPCKMLAHPKVGVVVYKYCCSFPFCKIRDIFSKFANLFKIIWDACSSKGRCYCLYCCCYCCFLGLLDCFVMKISERILYQKGLFFQWTFNSFEGNNFLSLPPSQYGSPSPTSSLLHYHVLR